MSSIFRNRFNLNPSFLSGGGVGGMFSISYSGFAESADGLRQFAETLDAQKVGEIIFEVFEEGAQIARENAAVDTGNMKANTLAERVGNGAAMHSFAPYSGFVDYGHATRGGGGFVPPQPFWSIGLAYIQTNLITRIIQQLGSGRIGIT